MRLPLLAAAVLFVPLCSAHADDLVTVASPQNNKYGPPITVTFTVPDPVLGFPQNPPPDIFTLPDIAIYVNGELDPQYQFVTFYSYAADGGLTVEDADNSYLLNLGGPALFTSSPDGLTFVQGETLGLFSGSEDFTTDITPVPASATPEPSSFALLGTGLLGVAAAFRRRLA